MKREKITDQALQPYLERYPADCRKLRRQDDAREAEGACTAAFARRFFPHLCRSSFSRMHFNSFARYDGLLCDNLLRRAGTRLALAAPRGNAKSTIHTLILPLADICFAREKYIVIISATLAQAAGRLRSIKNELGQNSALKSVLGTRPPRGASWSSRSIEVNGIRVDAFGAGAEIRGISFGECRPTKIILDDVEKSERVGKTSHREAMTDWYNEVIEYLGDNYTHIEIVGTVLHADSLLVRLMTRAGFESRKYKSIITWSQRQELWAEWQRLLTDLHDPHRVENAAAYMKQHRREMLGGVEVLWKQKENYEQLMTQMTIRGECSFWKEKQNSPVIDEARPLNVRLWTFFQRRGDVLTIIEKKKAGRSNPAPAVLGESTDESGGETSRAADPVTLSIADLTIYGFLDPATGSAGERGDFAAIATVGRDACGVLYVLDVWMEQTGPTEIAEQVVRLHNSYVYSAFGYETTGNQGPIGKTIQDACDANTRNTGAARLALLPWHNKTHKFDRIMTLQQLIRNRILVFSEHLSQEFRQQANDYPKSDHDDGLDALACAVQLAQNSGGLKAIVSTGQRIIAGVRN